MQGVDAKVNNIDAVSYTHLDVYKRQALDSWSAFIISSYENVEKDMGIKATKNRKIYNGMIKTYYYQFMGPKPPKNKNK